MSEATYKGSAAERRDPGFFQRIIPIDRGNILAMGPSKEIQQSTQPRVRQFLDRIADSTADEEVDHLRLFTEGIRPS